MRIPTLLSVGVVGSRSLFSSGQSLLFSESQWSSHLSNTCWLNDDTVLSLQWVISSPSCQQLSTLSSVLSFGLSPIITWTSINSSLEFEIRQWRCLTSSSFSSVFSCSVQDFIPPSQLSLPISEFWFNHFGTERKYRKRDFIDLSSYVVLAQWDNLSRVHPILCEGVESQTESQERFGVFRIDVVQPGPRS